MSAGGLTSIEIVTPLKPAHLSLTFSNQFERALRKAIKKPHKFKAGALFLGSPFKTVPAWQWSGLVIRALHNVHLLEYNQFQPLTFKAKALDGLNNNPKITHIFLTDEYEQVQEIALRSARSFLSVARGNNELRLIG